MTKFNYLISGLIALLALTPAFALAQTAGVNANVKATVTTPAGGANVTMSATAMTAAKERGHKELQRRVDSLTAINTRLQAMQKVTATFKQSIANAVQTQISAFQSLDAKIQADTDGPTLKTDIQSITQSYRVYALVLPQVRIAAAADRAITITSMMQDLGTKLAARVQVAGTAGADVTAMNNSLNDLASKITDINAKAQASVSNTASLAPDNGDKTKMAANTTALKQARTDLGTIGTDLKAARADIASLTKALKSVNVSGSASSTTSVQQ